jgi:hypothetical protein
LFSYILEYIPITFICNILLFLVFWGVFNTLFTYRSNNMLLIICAIFSVFLGPDDHLQVSKCPVAVWSVVREDQGGYVLLTANKVIQLKPDSAG